VQRDGDDGHRGGDLLEPRDVDPRRDQHQAVHLPVQQRLDAVLLTLGGGSGGHDDVLVRRGLERGADAAGDLGLERCRQLDEHNADGVGAATHPAGTGIRSVTELLDRRGDAGAHLRTHAVRPAYDLRDGGDRDPGRRGNVLDGRPLGPRVATVASCHGVERTGLQRLSNVLQNVISFRAGDLQVTIALLTA
jgi:hypothetical protein